MVVMSDELRAKKSAAGKLGAAALRAKYDPMVYTASARAAFMGSFPSKEALREHMLEMARKSAEVRRARRNADF